MADEQSQFEQLARLFADDVFEDLLSKALLVGSTRVFEEDLWITTPSTMIRRSLLDAVCKDEDLFPEFLSILSEETAALVQRFAAIDFQLDEGALEDDERVALNELQQSYGNDVWVWARDAFGRGQEFAGSDLRGFEPDEISDAIIRLLAAGWV